MPSPAKVGGTPLNRHGMALLMSFVGGRRRQADSWRGPLSRFYVPRPGSARPTDGTRPTHCSLLIAHCSLGVFTSRKRPQQVACFASHFTRSAQQRTRIVDDGWPRAAEPQPKKRSRHERPKRRCRRLRGRSWATDGTRIKRKKKETLMPLEKEEITEQIPRRCRWRLAASPGRSLLGIRVPSVFHPWLA